MGKWLLILFFSTWERRFWIWIRRRLPVCSEPSWLSTWLSNSNSPKYRNGKSDTDMFTFNPRKNRISWLLEIVDNPNLTIARIWRFLEFFSELELSCSISYFYCRSLKSPLILIISVSWFEMISIGHVIIGHESPF